jgi:hypothetical protein
MQTKVCSKCKLEKDVCEFYKDSKKIGTYRAKCKLCLSEESKIYSKNNREKRNEIQKNWRKENKEKINNYRKKYYDINPEKFILISRNYRLKNKEKVKNQNKTYYLKNLNYHKERLKKWIEINKNHRKEYQKKWKEINRDYIKEYKKLRYKNDLIYKLITNCRNRINSFLKTKKLSKNNKTFEIIGCNPEELKLHLEKQFKYGMGWGNRSEWHIDHIIPLSSADTEEDVFKLCHYTNLQPLWGNENLQKSNKLIKN